MNGIVIELGYFWTLSLPFCENVRFESKMEWMTPSGMIYYFVVYVVFSGSITTRVLLCIHCSDNTLGTQQQKEAAMIAMTFSL